MSRWLRIALSLPFALLALAFLGLALTEGPTQEAINRQHHLEQQAKLALFREAAALARDHRARTGKYPTEGRLASALNAPSDAHVGIGVDGEQEDGSSRVGCAQEEGFKPAPNDAFVLSSWNGNWFDCFAYPSTRHNLDLAPAPRPRGWGGVLLFGGIALLLALAAWAIWPPVRRSATVG